MIEENLKTEKQFIYLLLHYKTITLQYNLTYQILMMDVRNLLVKYFNVLEENGIAKNIQSKHVLVSFNISDSTDELWRKHDIVLKNIKAEENKLGKSLLDPSSIVFKGQ